MTKKKYYNFISKQLELKFNNFKKYENEIEELINELKTFELNQKLK